VQNRLAEIWHILASIYVIAGYAVWALKVKGGFEFMLRASVLSVVILTVAAMLSGALRRLIERGFAISQDARQHFPRLEARANRYLPVLHVVLRGAVAVVTVLALAQAWGLDTLALLSSEGGRRVVSSAISIAAVLSGALVVWELVSGAIERYLAATDLDGNAVQRSARIRTLLPLLRNALFVVLVVMVALIVLSELGVNIAPLLAGAGVVGVAIGFGSQTLVKDVITGAFNLFEDTMAVGDVVKLDSHAGVVEAMSIRAIRLRDATGALHTIPFSSISSVVNMSRDHAFANFEVGVGYGEDTDQVVEVIKAVGADLRADADVGPLIVDGVEVFGVERLDASAVVLTGRFKTLPQKNGAVLRAFNRRLKKRFDEVGIELPFHQTTLWFGQDKSGKAAPARVAVQEEISAMPRVAN
jgi:small conductance mechanosensitive channel